MSNFSFNAREVEPDAGRAGPVPAGWYVLLAKKLDLEPVSNSDNEKISAQFEIADGPFKGRQVFGNFNVKNASEKAEQIGRAQFSALCHAVNVLQIQATEQLLNIPFKAKLKITPATDQYEAKNEITAYKNVNDPSAVDVATGAPAAKPAAVPTPKAPPPAATPGQAWAASAPAAAPAASAPPATAPAAQVAAFTPPAAAQPWSQPATAPTPAAAPVAAPPAAPAAAPVQVPRLLQVQGAQYTIEQCVAGNWTEQQMIENGIAVLNPALQAAPVAAPVAASAAVVPAAAEQPAWATAPLAEAAAPAQASAPAVAPVEVNPVAQVTPPWMQNQ